MSQTVAETVKPVTKTEVLYWARASGTVGPISKDPETWHWYTDQGFRIAKTTIITTRIEEIVALPSSAEKSEK